MYAILVFPFTRWPRFFVSELVLLRPIIVINFMIIGHREHSFRGPPNMAKTKNTKTLYSGPGKLKLEFLADGVNAALVARYARSSGAKPASRQLFSLCSM